MARGSIGQERFGFAGRERAASSLGALVSLIDWNPVAALLDPLYPAAKGEPAWPPLAMFKALPLSIWYDLSDVKLAEALDDRTSFRRFCGFSANEATPERTALEQASDRVPECIAGAGRCLAQQRFEFGEHFFDGIEVGAVGRKIQDAGADGDNGLSDAGNFMRGQIVEDDDIA
jgi:hypothetical protein